MKKCLQLSVTILLVLTFCLIPKLKAQWSEDPSKNLKVCDIMGEQALPKISSTSDGGCYVSWWDKRDGEYKLYLQKFNEKGVYQWKFNGMMVSQHNQDSWLTDYSLISDNKDNAILSFADIRDSKNPEIFAYKINQDGIFLWGKDGIKISQNQFFNHTPQLVQSAEHEYIVVWSAIGENESRKIYAQKINDESNIFSWFYPVQLFTLPGFNIYNPSIVSSGNGSVIISYLECEGNPLTSDSPIMLGAQKINQDGDLLWEPGPVMKTGKLIQSIGGLSFYEKPQIVSDGNNGAFIAWLEDRDYDNRFDCYIQHLKSDGDFGFQENGIAATNDPQMNNFSPVIVYNKQTENIYLFWDVDNINNKGIYGQMFTSKGQKQWQEEGLLLRPLEGIESIVTMIPAVCDNNIFLFYTIDEQQDLNLRLEAFKVGVTGDMLLSNKYINISSPTKFKLHLNLAQDCKNMNYKLVWSDQRQDEGGIYAQLINKDGSLGYKSTDIEENQVKSNNISIYPNPANELLLISSEDYDIYSVSIISLSGQQIVSESYPESTGEPSKIELDTKELLNGFYICQIRTYMGVKSYPVIIMR